MYGYSPLSLLSDEVMSDVDVFGPGQEFGLVGHVYG